MNGIVLLVLIVIGWFILNRYVLPKLGIDNIDVLVDGLQRKGKMDGNFIVFDNIGSGDHRFERRK